MTCSAAQLAANRANAQKSTGPKSAEGKERSRANSCKHGLTGDGIVLLTEDAEAVAGRFDRLKAELRPSNELAEALVERVALMTVRLRRCARLETSAANDRILQAIPKFDEARRAEADELVASLGASPATNFRLLKSSPEGIDALIADWDRMLQAIDGRGVERWDYSNYLQADWLNGHNSVVNSDYKAYTFALQNRPECLTPEELAEAGTTHAERRNWAHRKIIEKIRGEIAALRDRKAALDTSTIEARRALAEDLALFDPSKEAVLARKYEAAAERSLYRALKELREVEAEAQARPPVASEPPPEPEELASFAPDDPEAIEPDPIDPPAPDFGPPTDAPAPRKARRTPSRRPGVGRS